MKQSDFYQFLQENPVVHIATLEEGKPRVRAIFLYSADEKGIVFHTGIMKDFGKQLLANQEIELCANNFESNVQVRVSGTVEEITDNNFKDEICNHPSRAFLKPWREAGPLSNFYDTFKVFTLKEGEAHWWTMETNFAPKEPVIL